MENQSKNSLILVTCVRGSADQIMVTAREQGARGGTVIKARWSGMEELERGYDLELTAERDIVAIVVPMCTIINMVIGYAFARLRARGKDVMFVIVLSTMMIPGIVTMIPQYILYNVLGITDTFFIYVLGNIGGGAYNIFLFKQFFSAMPKELEEAAKIDGAGTLQTIFRIFAPAAKPVIIIVAIGAFQGAWGDYMTPFMYFSPEKYPLAMALFGSVSYSMPGAPPGMVYEPLINAAAILMTIPPIIGFFFTQKHIVQGVVTTGLKG